MITIHDSAEKDEQKEKKTTTGGAEWLSLLNCASFFSRCWAFMVISSSVLDKKFKEKQNKNDVEYADTWRRLRAKTVAS